jgi:hypothetical protein
MGALPVESGTEDTSSSTIMRPKRRYIISFASNFGITDHLLCLLISREGIFSRLDAISYQRDLIALGRNMRLKKPYDGPLDGWAEFQYNEPIKKAWDLVNTSHVSEAMAWTLEEFLKKLPHDHRSPGVVMDMLKRWDVQRDVGR